LPPESRFAESLAFHSNPGNVCCTGLFLCCVNRVRNYSTTNFAFASDWHEYFKKELKTVAILGGGFNYMLPPSQECFEGERIYSARP